MNQVLFVLGPTATGKTKLALKLARRFNGELISADSRQVYKGLDIATGKDYPPQGSPLKIHGYDLVKPDEDWNVALFQDFAIKTIKQIQNRGKHPIVVGGTGLYIKSILEDFFHPTPPNHKLRQELDQLSVEELQSYLKKTDFKKFESMNHSDQNNPRRLIRAIEIVSSTPRKPPKQEKFDSLLIGLTAPIEILEQRIKKRVLARLKQNPKKELEYLKSFELPPTASPATSLGYQELDKYYSGSITKEELINLWTLHERQYAKRQLTWFKKQTNIHWFNITSRNCEGEVVDLVTSWYTQN